MVRANRELAVNRTATMRVVAIAAVAAALLLSGCGRKGPLDLPPAATAAPQNPAPQSAALPSGEQPQPSFAQPLAEADTRSVAPTGRKRRLPIDVLID